MLLLEIMKFSSQLAIYALASWGSSVVGSSVGGTVVVSSNWINIGRA